MSKIEETAERIAAPVAAQMGYELIDVEYTKEGSQRLLIIYIDKQGGVDLEDCERLSRTVEPMIDEADPIAEAYCLCVSSPGLDRPLKKPRDFERAMGQAVDVKLYKPMDGSKEYTGTLVCADEKSFTVATEKKEIAFIKKDVAKVSLHIDF